MLCLSGGKSGRFADVERIVHHADAAGHIKISVVKRMTLYGRKHFSQLLYLGKSYTLVLLCCTVSKPPQPTRTFLEKKPFQLGDLG